MAVLVLVGVSVAAVSVPTASAAPANDDFAAAQDLGSSLPVIVSGSNVGATSEPGEPRPVEGASGNSIWFKWTAVESRAVTVSTCDSEPDTAIGVYEGSAVAALTRVVAGVGNGRIEPFCDGTKVRFAAVAGRTYEISVDGMTFNAPLTEGAIKLDLSRTSQPDNDSFSAAEQLPLNGGSRWGENWGATKEVGEPLHRGDPGGASVWYWVTADRTGGILVNACEQHRKFDVAVYSGATVSGLTPVPQNLPSEACEYSFDAVAGASYFVAVDGRPGAGPGTVEMGEFTVGARDVPLNDDFADAFDIPFNLGLQFATFGHANAGGTKEPGEPMHAGNPGGASVWFSLTAPITGSFRVGPCANTFPALVGVYTGGSLTTLASVASQRVPVERACGPAAPGVLAFNVDAGTTYRIAVDGLDGAVGRFGMMSMASTERLPEPVSPTPVVTATMRPKTRLAKRRLQPARGRAEFVLRSDQPDSTFRCRLDGGKVRKCSKRIVYKGLRPGKHVFRAFAVDTAGPDTTPVVVRFRVPRERARGG